MPRIRFCVQSRQIQMKFSLNPIVRLGGIWYQTLNASYLESVAVRSVATFGIMSGEYPAVVSGATIGNLEVLGAPLMGDSYWRRVSLVLALVVSLAKLLWINGSINSVRAEIWACKGSRLAFILSSTESGEYIMLFSSIPSVASASTSSVTSSSCAEISSCSFQ